MASSLFSTFTVASAAQVDKEYLKQADKNERHWWIMGQGAKHFAVWGTVAIAGHFVLTKRLPLYARQTRAFKTFIVGAIPSAAFFTVTDRAAVIADRTYASTFSYVDVDATPVLSDSSESFDWSKEALTKFLIKNRYHVLGYTWGTVMGLSLIYNFSRKDIAMSQKLINSRMVAQAAGLAGFAGLAALQVASTAKPSYSFDEKRLSPVSPEGIKL